MFKKKGSLPGKDEKGLAEDQETEISLDPSESDTLFAEKETEEEDFLPFTGDDDFFKEPDFENSGEKKSEELGDDELGSDLGDFMENDESELLFEDSTSDDSTPESAMTEELSFEDSPQEDAVSEELIFGDSSKEDSSSEELSFEASGLDYSGGEEEEGEEKKGNKKQIILLAVLLLCLIGYAGFMYFPDFASPPQVATTKAKRVPINKPQAANTAKPTKPTKPTEKPAKKVQETPAKLAKEKPKEDITKTIAQIEKKEPARKVAIPEAKPKTPITSIPPKELPEEMKVVKTKLPVAGDEGYFIQSGAFIFKDNLKSPMSKIESLGYSPKVEVGSKTVKMNRLTVGTWDDKADTTSTLQKLTNEGYDAKVINIDESTYAILVGSYYYGSIAKEENIILRAKGYDANIAKKPIKMKVYNLLVGPFEVAEDAAEVEAALKGEGLKTAILQVP